MNEALYIIVYPILCFIIFIGFLRCFNIYSMILFSDNYLRVHNICSYIYNNHGKGLCDVLILLFMLILINVSVITLCTVIIYATHYSNDMIFNLFLTFCLYSGLIIFYLLMHLNIDTDNIDDDDCLSVASSVTIESV